MHPRCLKYDSGKRSGGPSHACFFRERKTDRRRPAPEDVCQQGERSLGSTERLPTPTQETRRPARCDRVLSVHIIAQVKTQLPLMNHAFSGSPLIGLWFYIHLAHHSYGQAGGSTTYLTVVACATHITPDWVSLLLRLLWAGSI